MKGLMIAMLCAVALTLGIVAAACGDDDGDDSTPTATEESADVEAGDPTEAPTDGSIEPGDLPAEFGRAPEESFALAREACDMWEGWEPDGSEDALAPIVAKAAEARAVSDVRDPVLEGLDRELSGLLNGLQTGEGSNVIELSNRLVGEVCEQVG